MGAFSLAFSSAFDRATPVTTPPILLAAVTVRDTTPALRVLDTTPTLRTLS